MARAAERPGCASAAVRGTGRRGPEQHHLLRDRALRNRVARGVRGRERRHHRRRCRRVPRRRAGLEAAAHPRNRHAGDRRLGQGQRVPDDRRRRCWQRDPGVRGEAGDLRGHPAQPDVVDHGHEQQRARQRSGRRWLEPAGRVRTGSGRAGRLRRRAAPDDRDGFERDEQLGARQPGRHPPHGRSRAHRRATGSPRTRC